MLTPETIHQGQPVLAAGRELDEAKGVMVMIHGRGATADGILTLADELSAEGFAYRAPQATASNWYPFRFIEPIEKNEPYLSSALQAVDDLMARLGENGFPPEKVILLGFSQGACLALEYAARNPRRYGGVIGLSGGVIGPMGMQFNYEGAMEGTPVLLGCSDTDAHIPVQRVHETAAAFDGLGANVDKRIYPGMGHTVNQDEITAIDAMMNALA